MVRMPESKPLMCCPAQAQRRPPPTEARGETIRDLARPTQKELRGARAFRIIGIWILDLLDEGSSLSLSLSLCLSVSLSLCLSVSLSLTYTYVYMLYIYI